MFDREIIEYIDRADGDARDACMRALLILHANALRIEKKSDVILKELGGELSRISKGYYEQLSDTLPKNKKVVEARTEMGKSIIKSIKKYTSLD